MDLIEGNLSNPIQHWYYSHKFKCIQNLVASDLSEARHIIDVGAGSALFSLEMLRIYPNLKVTAVDTGYENLILEDSLNRITYRNNGVGVSGDLYLLTDVLEHVADDVLLLREYVINAPIDSKFVITVPAFMSLWSGHDIFLKHFRRYRRDEIKFVTESAGLKILKAQYIYSNLFPLAWVSRRLPQAKNQVSQMKDHGKILNKIMIAVLRLDYFTSKILPFGVSIIVLAVKADK